LAAAIFSCLRRRGGLVFDGQFVFAQLMSFLPRREFNACVARYGGDRRERGFSCRDQFLCLGFAQLTFRESLRDVETCLRAMGPKLYHAGFRGRVSRSTLADANAAHDWRIYADFAQVLIRRARKLYAQEPLAVELAETVYALDSTTIDLCLSLFPWAKFRRRKGAVKLHTLLDLRGAIPCFIRVSHGKMHDVNVLDELPIEPAAFYVMDRGYVDFQRLHRFTAAGAFFVVRGKKNLDCTRRSRRPVDKATGLRSDQTVVLAGLKSSRAYPEALRRVAFYDAEHRRRLVFLTNNFTLPALTIARLYKCRWQIELFFKWIKQHLRIKAFYGTSDNAVRTQVWIAISVYVLVAIVKKELRTERSLSEILQILSVTLFEKIPMIEALNDKNRPFPNIPDPNQLSLFDL
jgi:IS4 transposase